MMQAVLPKWKNAFILNRIVVQSSNNATRIPHLAYFHSTASIFENRKPNQNNANKRGCEQPTKNNIRFYVRQRRADAKQALKDMLFRDGVSKFSSEQLPNMKERWEGVEADHSGKKWRLKASARRETRAMKEKRARRETKTLKEKRLRKERREAVFEQFDEHSNIFNATYGNKSYTWTFRSKEVPPFQKSKTGFQWKEKSQWNKLNESDIESESDDASCFVCKDSDRVILGLPSKGPLKIGDVKHAFRLAALKWHPDRHQGPTQASAEDKFKRCVDAYKSLCSTLSTA